MSSPSFEDNEKDMAFTRNISTDGKASQSGDPHNVVVAKEGADLTKDGAVIHDAVFGDIAEGGPNYRGLGWIRTAVLSIKVQIGLGVLSIPSVLASVGLLGGILLIFTTAVIATWGCYVVGKFKLAHPGVYSFADIGQILAGSWGREILGLFSYLQLTAVAGGSMLGIATAVNNISDGYGCNAVWALVGAIATFGFSSIRTLDRISWLGWVGLCGIMGAVITLAIAVGVQDRPDAAPQVGPWDPQVITVGTPSFIDAMTAVCTIVFSFAGVPNFVNVISEMKEPRHFGKSLAVCQSFVTATYLIIGCVVYHYCGIYVSSPALGSAGPLLKKVCYGIALPGLLVGAIINTHSPAKYIFLRLMKGSPHINDNSWRHWAPWLGCVAFNTVVSYLIAEAIPFFGDLVSLIGALIATVLSLQAPAWMWLYENRARLRTDRTTPFLLLVVFNGIIIVTGSFCTVGGTYASVVAINRSLHSGSTNQPFSC
ncbi:hypothetical protein JCM10450v2_000075 [Rhodotorula kratochvilovae]